MSSRPAFALLVPATIFPTLALAEPPSSDEIRAIVAEAAADAGSRTSLLAQGATSGHDGRFFIASPDGAFRLNVGGLVQFRYYANVRDEDNTAGLNPGDDLELGFQTSRTRLNFTGTVIDPNWFYRIESQFSFGTGANVLLDAFAGRTLGDGWSVQWGQMKFAFAREQNLAPGKYLTVDQSVVNTVFGQGYSQGVQVARQTDAWRFFAGFSDGLRSQNTDILSPAESDFALSGRVEHAFAGPWTRFDDFTSPRGSDFAATLGAAAWYQQSANSPAPTDVDTDYLGYTADLQLEGDGWNAFVAGHGRRIETRGPVGAGASAESDDFGAMVQGGYRILADTELFARWEGIFLDDDATPTGDDDDSFNFVTVGVNHYFAGHAAKLTADVVWSIDETAALVNTGIGGFPNSGIGLLGSSEGGEVAVRVQFQLVF